MAAPTRSNKVVLNAGSDGETTRQREGISEGAILPGQILDISAVAGKDYKVSAIAAGGTQPFIVAKEQALHGEGTWVNGYADNDTIFVHHALPNDELQVRAVAATYAKNAKVTTNGDGRFKAASGGDVVYGQVIEGITVTGPLPQLKIRVLR